MKAKPIALLLLFVAAAGIGMARYLYPVENEFSIMRCTVSFLGSPDADRNPAGWRYYQVGMTALVLAMGQMIGWRHRNFRASTGPVINKVSAVYAVGLVLILVSVWVADSDEMLWIGIRSGTVHTKIAIIAILTLLVAVSADGVVLSRAGLPGKSLWPFRIYAGLWVAAIVSLASWEWRCARDPSLKHWPGEGIHSTPMWEWILLVYLIGFVVWISRGELAGKMPGRR